jgi:hypothetical protein
MRHILHAYCNTDFTHVFGISTCLLTSEYHIHYNPCIFHCAKPMPTGIRGKEEGEGRRGGVE